MTTDHGSQGADREDELLRAVLAEETAADEVDHGRRDPISPAAHARLRSGTAAPGPQERPSVDDVYGRVDRARSLPAAPESGAVVGDTAAPAEPTASGQVFIGADAETPDLVRARRRRPRPTVPPAPVPEAPSESRPAEPEAAPETVSVVPEAAPESAPVAPEAAPEGVSGERRTRPSTPPPFEEEAPTALAEGLGRTGPDTAEIRRIEADSPWSRLHSPQDDADAVSLVPSTRRPATQPGAAGSAVPDSDTAAPSTPQEAPAGAGSGGRLPLMLGVLVLLALLVAVLVAVLT